MSASGIARRALRLLRKPPRTIIARLAAEARRELDRFVVPRFARTFDDRALLLRCRATSIDALWERLLHSRAWPMARAPWDRANYEATCPGDTNRILEAAARAMRHEVDLLGTGPVRHGKRIDWSCDCVTGDRWPNRYFRSIDYVNRGRPSDVKRAWETSRLQWAIPIGQAYRLTRDESYAMAVRELLEDWIDANPVGCSVNWGVTMEPALRIFSWTWLFQECGPSVAWREQAFRSRFLRVLYLHGWFTERFIERSSVNGNHFTADAAALVFAGGLFMETVDGARWLAAGIRELEAEVVLQINPDGVDFEASAAYHRLVAECLLLAAMAANAAGRQLSATYSDRLRAMARFTAAYSRPDGSSPLWGDADDARALPMDGQPVTDHRYLVGLIALHLRDDDLLQFASGPRSEAAWYFGVDAARQIPVLPADIASTVFPDGGVYVMRRGADHVFIDCGPVGLAGHGGHGHNDLLSCEAMLDGVLWLSELGCYTYTSNFSLRNAYRGTASHNTPRVAESEINRIPSTDELWSLIPDARFSVSRWHADARGASFTGSHDGYNRLSPPVGVTRQVDLSFETHTLRICDDISGPSKHLVEIPLHFGAGVDVRSDGPGAFLLARGARRCRLTWQGDGWEVHAEVAQQAPSYGRLIPISRLRFVRRGTPARLEVSLQPVPGGMT